MKKIYSGVCALCGKPFNDLTFEHIPPKSAFNSKPVKSVSVTEFFSSDKEPWELEGLHYSSLQKGMGRYSLCEECNNKTGHLYGSEYQKMANATAYALAKNKQKQIQGFRIPSFYPLRFIKQVLSLFCSINSDYTFMTDIRQFVLNKDAIHIDKWKYKLCMYLTESRLERQLPQTVVFKQKYGIVRMSEICAYPLGFVLYFDPKERLEYNGIDITCFGDYNYNDFEDVILPLKLFNVNSWIPEDTRTKDEIKRCIEDNKILLKEYGNGMD